MNRIIRQTGFIVLCVFAVSMGVSAQTSQQYRAEIPFNFDAGGRHYSAGQYSVGPLSSEIGSAVVLRDLQKRNARVLGANTRSGNNDWDNPGTLTFVKINGQYRLSQISTATFSMKMKAPKLLVAEAEKTPASEVVAIRLTN